MILRWVISFSNWGASLNQSLVALHSVEANSDNEAMPTLKYLKLSKDVGKILWGNGNRGFPLSDFFIFLDRTLKCRSGLDSKCSLSYKIKKVSKSKTFLWVKFETKLSSVVQSRWIKKSTSACPIYRHWHQLHAPYNGCANFILASRNKFVSFY